MLTRAEAITEQQLTHPREVRQVGVALAIALMIIYALLLNPYWVRHGDSEVFLSLGRSLARGEGFRFNGQPVSTVPPGWPIVLSGAMKLTSRLLLLKLIPMGSIIGFLMISYAVLCRYTKPLVAALCVLTAGMLQPVFGLSYMFFSDPLFALLCWAALWQAVRIGEGDTPPWRLALVVALTAAATAVRWNSLFWCALLVGAMVKGDLWPRLDRRWATAGITFAVALAVFFGLRHSMRVDPSGIDPRYDEFLSGQYGILDDDTVTVTVGERLSHCGMWISGLLAYPAMQQKATRELCNVLGWILIGIMCIPTIAHAKRRDWLTLAVMLHLAVLFARWASPLPRYIMLLAPLILWMIYDGITRCFALLPMRLAPVRTALLNAVFAVLISGNGVIYLTELLVMRNHHFYQRVEGGTIKELVDAAWYLDRLPKSSTPYEIAISPRRMNLDHEYFTGGHFRALNFLTNRPILSVPSEPEELCREPDADVIKWLKEHNARFYLYEPPIWVIMPGHFSLLTSSQGIPINKSETEWRLYEIVGDEARRVELEPTEGWPRNVPGL
ncbi:MAG TPA: hypothetical protein VH518_05405 [Tepidisphaeraceae bacterium]|jgi:hypothetical protein